MHISNGKYHPSPHLACQLLEFPDSNLTTKQVQQFLGIINFIRDFLPHVTRYTSILSALLKKNPSSWDRCHTDAITKLKEIAQSPPALTIPSTDQLILQTDASDTCCGAILIEEKDGQKSYCGHASGQFKDA
ncbi:hypothetical protein LWI28_000671 [Acer negundo]|uniref:Reverse transcriptase/retrotransposon-derived protein RNase H-like domain-containing protein n=1 Tax=Acer negundo TaxID=4023 RepID=A0AAD5IPY7_ACENE|nr:hypothetical protein LWI28_000671 [Acer negundo]